MSRPRREKRRSIRRRRWGNCRCRRSSPTGRTSECTASRGLQYCPVRYSPKAARQAGSGARQKAGNFLPKPLVRGIVFQKSAAPRPGLLIGAGHSSFGRGAKRNGVEAIENNEFREMPHFAPLRIPRAYACVAKSFASPREMNRSASPGSARRRRPKTRFATRATALRFALRLGRADDGPKWRRKRLKLFKTGSKWPPGSRTPGNRSGDLRYHADGRDVPPYAWGQAKLTREEQS